MPRCPSCAHEALLATPLADAEVLACGGCQGVFVPAPVMKRFTDARDPVAARSLDEPRLPIRVWLAQRRLACPTCRKPMTERPFAEGLALLVDECASHGIWFDGGELREAASIVASSGLARAGREVPPRVREAAVHVGGQSSDGGSALGNVLGFLIEILDVFL